LLYKVVQKVRTIDLPQTVSNHDMGLVFEELIRRFAEGSNETAGEHFTPRDIVRLTTSLVFMEDDEALTKPALSAPFTTRQRVQAAFCRRAWNMCMS
jgi:type I restriction enzyme M protein